MVVIYEVNQFPDAEVLSDWMDFLKPHVQDMLHLDGPDGRIFKSAEIVSVEPDESMPAGKCGVACVYRCDSRQDLQHYFDVHAAKLRGDATKLAIFSRVTFSRRILTVIE